VETRTGRVETRTGRRLDLAVRETSKGEKAARLAAADSASVVELNLSGNLYRCACTNRKRQRRNRYKGNYPK
jgi:hypothetical protein